MSDDEWWILPEWPVFHCFHCNVSCRGGVELAETYFYKCFVFTEEVRGTWG